MADVLHVRVGGEGDIAAVAVGGRRRRVDGDCRCVAFPAPADVVDGDDDDEGEEGDDAEDEEDDGAGCSADVGGSGWGRRRAGGRGDAGGGGDGGRV